MNRTLCVDPGASGGFAWDVDVEGVICAPMPDTEGSVLDALRLIRAGGVERLVMEDQAGFGHIKGIPGSALFTFGRSFGFILGAAQALGYRVELVRPQKWQKALSLGSKASAGGKGEFKRKLKAEAQRRFPECAVTLKTADALLLLAYSRNGL